MDYTDIRNGLVAAIAVNVEEPIFESQTKTKLGSTNMTPGGVTVNKYVGDFIKLEVDNFLHKNADVAEVMQQKYRNRKRNGKPSQASRSWHANVPRRPTCTTASCATAASTSTTRKGKEWKKTPASSSPRETRRAVPSPKAVT